MQTHTHKQHTHTNYRLMLSMNIESTILKSLMKKALKVTIGRLTSHNQIESTPGMQRWLHIRKKIVNTAYRITSYSNKKKIHDHLNRRVYSRLNNYPP